MPVENKKCVFPFRYADKLFYQCTNYMAVFYWCATDDAIDNGSPYVYNNVFYPTVSVRNGWGVCHEDCPRENSIAPGNSTIDPAMLEDARITTHLLKGTQYTILLKETEYNKTCYEWNSDKQKNDGNTEPNDIKLQLSTHPLYHNGLFPFGLGNDVRKCENLCKMAEKCLFFTYTPKPSFCYSKYFESAYEVARPEMYKKRYGNYPGPYNPISGISGLRQCGFKGIQYLIQYTDYRPPWRCTRWVGRKFDEIMTKQSTVAIYTKNQSYYGIDGRRRGPVYNNLRMNHRCKLYWL